MKRFVKFEAKPLLDNGFTYDIHAVEGATEEEIRKNAEEFAKCTQEWWAFGTYRFISILSKKEAMDCVEFQLAYAPQAFVGDIFKLYRECYEED